MPDDQKKGRRPGPPAPRCAPARGPKLSNPPLAHPGYEKLTSGQKLVYLEVERMCPPEKGTGWRRGMVTRDQIGSACSMHPDTVRRHLRALESKGWLRAAKRGGLPGIPVEYYVLRHADLAADIDPASLPEPCWSPEERLAYKRAINRCNQVRALAEQTRLDLAAALDAGNLDAARRKLADEREARSVLAAAEEDFLRLKATSLRGVNRGAKGRSLRPSTTQNPPLDREERAPEPRQTRPSTAENTHPIPPAPLPIPSNTPLSPSEGEGGASPVPEEQEEAAALPAPFALSDLMGPEPGASADEPESPEPPPGGEEEEEAVPDPECSECAGSGKVARPVPKGFDPDGSRFPEGVRMATCDCVLEASERLEIERARVRAERIAAERAARDATDSGLLSAGAARNADGGAASVDELPVDAADTFKARRLALKARPAWPGPGEALTILGGKEAGVAALAMAETVRRQGSRVLALVDVQARQEDSEAGVEKRLGPVALRRAEGLGALVLRLEGTRSHPVWSEKLRLFLERARSEGAALIVATSMSPEEVERTHGPGMVEALGGTDAHGGWKEIVR